MLALLLSVALAGPLDIQKMMARFHEPKAVNERLKSHSHGKGQLSLVASSSKVGTDMEALPVKVMRELGDAQREVGDLLKNNPKLRMEEEDLLRQAADKAHSAAEGQALALSQMRKHKLALSEQKHKLGKVTVDTKMSAKTALRSYVSGMKHQVKAEKALEKETDTVESSIADLKDIPADVKETALAALQKAEKIEGNQVKNAEKAFASGSRLLLRK